MHRHLLRKTVWISLVGQKAHRCSLVILPIKEWKCSTNNGKALCTISDSSIRIVAWGVQGNISCVSVLIVCRKSKRPDTDIHKTQYLSAFFVFKPLKKIVFYTYDSNIPIWNLKNIFSKRTRHRTHTNYCCGSSFLFWYFI